MASWNSYQALNVANFSPSSMRISKLRRKVGTILYLSSVSICMYEAQCRKANSHLERADVLSKTCPRPSYNPRVSLFMPLPERGRHQLTTKLKHRSLHLRELNRAGFKPTLRSEDIHVLPKDLSPAVHDPSVTADNYTAWDVVTQDVDSLWRHYALKKETSCWMEACGNFVVNGRRGSKRELKDVRKLSWITASR